MPQKCRSTSPISSARPTPQKQKKAPHLPKAKERVKYNALRHGFTGQVLIMTPEEREKFDAFVNA